MAVPATVPKAERHGRSIVWIRIGIRPVIVGRRRRISARRISTRWGISTRRIDARRRRRAITIGRAVRTLTTHAGIIGGSIVPLHVAGGRLCIGGTDRGAGQKTRARADCGARAGMTGSAADDGAQGRTTKRSADRAVGLSVAGGLARRHAHP